MHKSHVYARLGRADDLLPWSGGRLFGRGSDHEGYEIVDPGNGFTAALINDGSIVVENPPAPKPPPPEPAPTAAP